MDRKQKIELLKGFIAGNKSEEKKPPLNLKDVSTDELRGFCRILGETSSNGIPVPSEELKNEQLAFFRLLERKMKYKLIK